MVNFVDSDLAIMKVRFVVVGKTDEKYLLEGISKYEKRLKHYAQYSMEVIPDVKKSKKLSSELQKVEEGKEILSKVAKSDYIVLLDEKGKSFSSKEFAKNLEKKMVSGVSSIVFIIGGPYGFSDDVYQRANEKLSLSKMTFSHQMVRLFFVEQLYRGFSILKGEKYHHE